MYLAIDVGGTKTLVATFLQNGELQSSVRFATPKSYSDFLETLSKTLKDIKNIRDFNWCCIAAPGKVDRETGTVIAFGNLPWKNIPMQRDLEKLVSCPVSIENDANLAGLSEALYIKDKYHKVVYLTISTGIGFGVIIDGIIDPNYADIEAGQMKINYEDKLQIWEDIASGRAIKERYKKIAADINDKATWNKIVKPLALGINSVVAIIQPEIIVIGGSVGQHFKKFKEPLMQELKKYRTPLTPTPKIIKANHAEEAVIYGCYFLAKSNHESARKKSH